MGTTNASPSMVNAAANLATTKKNNTTATPVAKSNLNMPKTPTVTPPPTPAPKANPGSMESNMKQAADSVPEKPTTECAKIINEAEDLISALESIGSMYGIPSENIVCDPTLNDIKVNGDTIIAPDTSAQGKGGAIMKSIAAVLDYISQRIDQKIDNFQADSIEKGVINDHIKNDANPAKGNIIGRHVDPDGNEILVYDTGLVDMPNSFTAVNFVNQLRANGTIPPIKYPNQPTSMGVSYFTDEDDITNGTATDPPPQGGSDYGDSGAGPAVATPNQGTSVQDSPEEVNMADTFGESAQIMEMMAKMNDTRHLGYDLLTKQGFNFLKPIDFYMESSGGKGKGKEIKPEDIKHLKFDNKHIIKAIKLINECRAEQSYVQGKHFDLKTMVNNPKWDSAVKELEAQFDCHINIRFVQSRDDSASGGAFTTMFEDEVRPKVTVSKSKGFQLNGLPITIYVINSFFTMYCPTDQKLFGQFAVSVLLHEIFHNVYKAMLMYSSEFNAMMSTTLITASLSKSARVRRKLLTNFVNAADSMGLIKLNPMQKKVYVKKLLVVCSMDINMKNLKDAKSLVEEGDSKSLDNYINRVEKIIARDKKFIYGHGSAIGYTLLFSIETILGMVGLAYGISGIAVFALSWMLSTLGSALTTSAAKSKLKRDIHDRETGNKKDYEEHWCDMFAAIYSLPEGFFNVVETKMTAATMRNDQIKRLHDIELAFVNIYGDTHPPTTERLAASVKYSKKLLDSGEKIDPSVKDYLEWIIENHSRILEVEDIDTKYSKATFDPKTAEDIDLHIQNLISKGNIQLTEQAITYMLTEDNDPDEYDY